MTEWDYQRDYTRVRAETKPARNVACLTLPMTAFRRRAQTFGDFPFVREGEKDVSTAWRLVTNAYYRMIELACARGNTEVYMEIITAAVEQAMGEQEESADNTGHADSAEELAHISRPPLAYRFWTLMNPSGGSGKGDGSDSDDGGDSDDDDDDEDDSKKVSLDNIMLEILTYQRQLQRLMHHKKKARRADAEKEIRRLQDSGAQAHELYKSIASTSTWKGAVALALDMEFDDMESLLRESTETAFSPALAFRNTPDGSLRAQGAEALFGVNGEVASYLVSAGGLGHYVRWPVRSNVYRVPLHKASRACVLFPMSGLPHCLADATRTRNYLQILLPALVNLAEEDQRPAANHANNNGAADDDSSSGGSSGGTAGSRRRFQPRTASEAFGGVNAARHALTAVLKGRARTASEALQNTTEISGTRDSIKKARSDKSGAMSEEIRANATPYNRIQRATSAAINKISSGIAPQSGIAARKLYLLSERAALASFEALSADSPGMSPSMRKILDKIDEMDLLNCKAVRKFFRRPLTGPDDPSLRSKEPLSMDDSFTRKLIAGFDTVFHVNHLHALCLNVLTFSLDTYRYAKDLHANFCAISKLGGTGKSNLWRIMIAMSIPGSVEKKMYITEAAFTATEADGNINMSDAIYCFDEMPKDMFMPRANGDNKAAERFKLVLTECEAEVDSVVIMDDGQRKKVTTIADVICTFFISLNGRVDQVEHAVQRRFDMASVPEGAPDSKPLSDKMNNEQLDPPEMANVKMAFRRPNYFRQATLAVMFKLMHAGALPQVSMDIIGALNMALTQELRRTGLFVEPNPSVFTRITIVARIFAMWRVVIDTYCLPYEYARDDAEYEPAVPLPDEVTPRSLVEKLPPKLFATAGDWAKAIGLLSEELINPLEHAIRVALRQFYEEKSREINDFDDLFYTDPNSSDGRSGAQRDYNYVVFDSQYLVQEIRMKIPRVMYGHHTNDSAIRARFDEFTERTLNASPFVRAHDTATHMPLREVDEKTDRPPRVQAAARWINGRTGFAVHVGFLAPKDAMSVDDLADLSAQQRQTGGAGAGAADSAHGSVSDVDDADMSDAFSPAAAANAGTAPRNAMNVLPSLENKDCSAAQKLLMNAIGKILNVETNIPRRLVFGVGKRDTSEVTVLETHHPLDPVKRGCFSVNLVTVANKKRFDLIPELQEMIPDASKRLGKDKLKIKMDLDTFAARRHYERWSITTDPIPHDFLNCIHVNTDALNQPVAEPVPAAATLNEPVLAVASTVAEEEEDTGSGKVSDMEDDAASRRSSDDDDDMGMSMAMLAPEILALAGEAPRQQSSSGDGASAASGTNNSGASGAGAAAGGGAENVTLGRRGYFAGQPVELMSPDVYKSWIQKHARQIMDRFIAEDPENASPDNDVDFNPAEFTLINKQTGRNVYHADLLRHHFSKPEFFGYKSWREVKKNYKMIAHLPMVRDNFISLAGV